MSKYYLYCTPKKINNGIAYATCVTVNCKPTLDYDAIKNIAIQEYGDEYNVHQVVSKDWNKLLKKYNKLYQYLLKHDVLYSGDGECEITNRTCCGYKITDGSIWTYGIVLFDEFSQIQFKICNLSDVDFANIVYTLQEMADYYKSCK